MRQYIVEGIWALLQSVVLAVVIYAVFSLILGLLKKRSFKKFSELPKKKMAAEFLWLLYTCAILKITGIIGMPLFTEGIWDRFLAFLTVPFVGSSIKMITLNVLLFMPFGFLLPLAFNRGKWTWWKALLVGLGASVIIEVLQLFGARMFEIDDIIANAVGTVAGFLIYKSVFEIIKAETRKKGVIRGSLTVAVTAAVLFGLSFVANGDSADAYSEMGVIENEEVSVLTVYSPKGQKEYLMREITDEDEYFTADFFYSMMGNDISSQAAGYTVSEKKTDAREIINGQEGIYVEAVFDDPQDFSFYNKPFWKMTGVTHILYRVDDGALWYGSDKESFDYAAVYAAPYGESQFDYYEDEELSREIQYAITNN